MGGSASTQQSYTEHLTAVEVQEKLQAENVITNDTKVESINVAMYPNALHDCSVVQITYTAKNPGPKKLIVMRSTVDKKKQEICEAMGVGFMTELLITQEFLDKVQMRNLKILFKQPGDPTSIWFEFPEGGVPKMDNTADIRQAVKGVIHLV
jgi:hypothetical protein